MNAQHDHLTAHDRVADGVPSATSRSIDWYSEGQSRTVEVGGVLVTVRFVGRYGRRARIVITAPAGAEFSGPECNTVPTGS